MNGNSAETKTPTVKVGVFAESLVGRAGFEPATNGLKVAGSECETLNIQRLATLAKLDSQRHSRGRIDTCRIVRHKCVTPAVHGTIPDLGFRSAHRYITGLKACC